MAIILVFIICLILVYLHVYVCACFGMCRLVEVRGQRSPLGIIPQKLFTLYFETGLPIRKGLTNSATYLADPGIFLWPPHNRDHKLMALYWSFCMGSGDQTLHSDPSPQASVYLCICECRPWDRTRASQCYLTPHH